MSWEEILELLSQGEGLHVEFRGRVSDPQDLAPDMVAFANTSGGIIIIGLDFKTKYLFGASIDRDWIFSIGAKYCVPKIVPSVEVVSRADKNIFIVRVSEGNSKPYKTDDICYIRDENITRPAITEEENELRGPWPSEDMNTRQKKALNYLTQNGTITNREFRELFGVSHKTAHIELTNLVIKGILTIQGAGRSTSYIFPSHLKNTASGVINGLFEKQ